MFEDIIVETCPELFFEIIRLIPEIQGSDLLSLMLVNKKWFYLIDKYSNQILFKLLCLDNLPKDYFTTIIKNNEISNKELFIKYVQPFWSEYLQTYKPHTQLSEKDCGNIINKCQENKCWLTIDNNKSNDKTINKYTYRHIRSKYPITKNTTMYFYVKYLQKEVDNSTGSFLLIGIISESLLNGIAGKQRSVGYVGEIGNIDCNLNFNTSFASNGYISGRERNNGIAGCFEQAWKKGDVISIKIEGFEERSLRIGYYLNDELMLEIKNVLEGVDVINVEGNRLYFDANIKQDDNNVDNTVIVASYSKPTIKELEQNIL